MTALSLSSFMKGWAATAAFILIVDAIFLGVIARDFYASQLGSLMRDQINFPVAALFYVFYSACVVYLASTRGIDSGWTQALVSGAVLGFAAYGTYDVTNYSTLKNWPVLMSFVDVAWGTTLTAAASVVGYWVVAR